MLASPTAVTGATSPPPFPSSSVPCPNPSVPPLLSATLPGTSRESTRAYHSCCSAALLSPLFHPLVSSHLTCLAAFLPFPPFQSDQSPRLPQHQYHPSAPVFRLSHPPVALASCSLVLALAAVAVAVPVSPVPVLPLTSRLVPSRILSPLPPAAAAAALLPPPALWSKPAAPKICRCFLPGGKSSLSGEKSTRREGEKQEERKPAPCGRASSLGAFNWRQQWAAATARRPP